MKNTALIQQETTLAPALSLRNLSKLFGGVHALNNVNLTVESGKIHGLLGPNGSGKSTLIKVMAGFHAPEPGAVLHLFGNRIDLPLTPSQFRGLGMAFVHQNLGLLASLSVLENLRMGAFATQSYWKISWRKERLLAEEIFEKFGVKINPQAKVGSLPPIERALVAIIRAMTDIKSSQSIHGGNGILILDEPTPFLPKAGVEQLFELMRGIVQEGASVIFVSHDIEEVMAITDEATILRDGQVVGTLTTQEATQNQFVELIVGRKIIPFGMNPRKSRHQKADFSIKGLSGGNLNNVSMQLRKGEILGLTGLMGSGFNEVPYLLYGATKAQTGKLSINGKDLDICQFTPKTSRKFGMALLPSDRLNAGAVGKLPIVDNVTLPILGNFLTRRVLNRWKMVKVANELCQQYNIKPHLSTIPLEALSGGNQQKVVMAKWLQTSPALLLLDEPTQGVDIKARQHIYKALENATTKGCAILCSSTDYEQLAQICDRVLIFARGKIIQELVGNEVTKERITEQCYLSMNLANEQSNEQQISCWHPENQPINFDLNVATVESKQKQAFSLSVQGAVDAMTTVGWNPDILTINDQQRHIPPIQENSRGQFKPIPLHQPKSILGWNPDILITNEIYIDFETLHTTPITQSKVALSMKKPITQSNFWNPDILALNELPEIIPPPTSPIPVSKASKTVGKPANNKELQIQNFQQQPNALESGLWNPDILTINKCPSKQKKQQKVKKAKVIFMPQKFQQSRKKPMQVPAWNPDISEMNL